MAVYLHSSQNSEDIYMDLKDDSLQEKKLGIIHTKKEFGPERKAAISELGEEKIGHLEDSHYVKPQIRDIHETSPFKQAVKGFVLNKLSKKVGSSHLLSGITEKIVKKLEDGKDNIPANIEHNSDNELNLSVTRVKENTSELGISVACELKSVVANDLVEVPSVEEASECFEELKSSVSDFGINNSKILKSNSISLPASPAHRFAKRASSISSSYENMGQSQVMHSVDPSVMSKSNENVNFEYSVSDLQESDISSFHSKEIMNLEQSTSDKKNEIELKEIKGKSESKLIRSQVLSSSEFESYPYNVYPRKKEEKPKFISIKSVFSIFSSFKHIFLSLPLSNLFLLASVIVHNSDLLSSYFAFIFDGIVIAYVCYSYICIIVQTPVVSATQNFPFSDPQMENASLKVVKSHRILKGCVKILKGTYDPELQKNYPYDIVDIYIENCCLKISPPKKRPSQEVLCDAKSSISYDLHGAQISIVPKDLSKKRLWKKKYPICIILPLNSKKVDSVPDGDIELGTSPCVDYISFVPFEDALLENPQQRALYLFALTDREKESLFWALKNCLREPENKQKEAVFDISPKLDYTSLSYTSLLEMSSDESLSLTEDFEGDNEIGLINKERNSLNFDNYMEKLMDNYQKFLQIPLRSRSFEDLRHSKDDFHVFSDTFMCKDIKTTNHHSVDWLNVVLGRLFYDFLTQEYWAENVRNRIQKKLDKIEMPSFIDPLQVTDVFLGTSVPQLHTVSNPVVDYCGVWFDFDFEYSGSFQMTLETRLKMTKEKGLASTETVDGSDIKQSVISSESSDDDESETKIKSLKRRKLINRIEKWISYRHFQTVAQSKFVKRYVGDISNMPLTLTVEVNALHGVLTLNIPTAPSDRIWYGFRKDPVLSFMVYPKVGSHEINLSAIVQMIQRKLIQEFKKALVMPNMDDLVIPIMYSPIYE